MKLLIMPNLEKENTVACARAVKEYLRPMGCTIMYQKQYEGALGDCGDVFDDDIDRLLDEADVVIAIGGDGTIIHTAKLAASRRKPVFGINSGHLGFTAGLELEELSDIVQLTEGEISAQERMMLDVRVVSYDGEEKLCCRAINDAVISRGTLARIINLNVSENGREALSYRADGIIVSTPTGSTAYALSAGGPVISPQVNCIPVTPICPHDLSSRTVIFSDSSKLVVSTGEGRGSVSTGTTGMDIYLTVDGDISCRLEEGDRVEIMRSEVNAFFIRLKNTGISEILKAKFGY